MRVSIFGLGYVGTVSAGCLASSGHHVIGVDINPEKCAALLDGRAPFVETDLDVLLASGKADGLITATTSAAEAVAATDATVVCVGTPSRSNGSHDYSHLYAVMDQVATAAARKSEAHVVVIRSTVMPGTVAGCVERLHAIDPRIHVAFVPEFLREGTAVHDFLHPPYVVAGSSAIEGLEAARELFSVAGAEFHSTTVEVAEMMKCVANAFHALKITFANEIGTLAGTLGLDGREVMHLLCQDRVLNISPAYLRPGFAYGGSCLPKDVAALQHAARAADLDLPLVSSLATSNRAQIDRLTAQVAVEYGTVAILGLAFKPGTDDLRDSPMVEVAERLLGKGMDVRICDPAVQASRLMGANLSYVEQRLPHLSRLLHDPGDVTDADVFIVSHKTPQFQAVVEAAARPSVVYDLVGLPAAATAGCRTIGVAWPTTS
jgi:GDP-mannose 6-dehydrogenase